MASPVVVIHYYQVLYKRKGEFKQWDKKGSFGKFIDLNALSIANQMSPFQCHRFLHSMVFLRIECFMIKSSKVHISLSPQNKIKYFAEKATYIV